MSTLNEDPFRQIVEEFEAIWAQGIEPCIPDFISRASEEDLSPLIKELVLLDVSQRWRRTREVRPEQYQELGELAESIAQAEISRLIAQSNNLTDHDAGSPNRQTTGWKVPFFSASEEPDDFESPEQGPLQSGARLGRYLILETLGGGGMGSVYKAEDTLLDRWVALKVPHFARLGHRSDEVRKRFRREARAMAKLKHPNLCPVFDFGCIDDIEFLTMAFIEGRSLALHLREHPRQAPIEVLKICSKVALALEAAHQSGVIHRDLKPANVMLTPEHEPIVIDFGLARKELREDFDHLTKSGLSIGTPEYMSPEQARGESNTLTSATDIFSLGIMAFEMLTGTLPFLPGDDLLTRITQEDAAAPSSLRPDLPIEIDTFCLRMLAREQEARFSSMREVAEAADFVQKSLAARAQRVLRKTISPGYRYDICVSFAAADIDSIAESQSGWISDLIQDLDPSLCRLHGHSDEISLAYLRDSLHESKSADRPPFLDAKTLLIVTSPRYSASVWSAEELAGMRELVQQRAASGEIIVAEMSPTRDKSFDSLYSAVTPIRFWRQTTSGRTEVLGRNSSSAITYYSKVDDLARSLMSALKLTPTQLPMGGSADAERRIQAYLCEVADDLEPLREEVRRFLEQSKIDIHPQKRLSRQRDEYIAGVCQDLAQCDLFIQLLGREIGTRVPGRDESYTQLQYDCTESWHKQVLQWRSTDLVANAIADEGHRQLVFGSHVQSSTIQEFKHELAGVIDNLRRERDDPMSQRLRDSFIFLNVDQKDATDSVQLCQIFDESGLGYATPTFEGRPDEIRRDLEGNLIDCDGLIIYYGRASAQWVREQLRMWRRVLHKRERQLHALAVFEGPPEEKSVIGMQLPGMELLNCRHGIDRAKIESFLNRMGQ